MAYLIRPMERDDLERVSEIDREAFPTQWPPPNYRQELREPPGPLHRGHPTIPDGDRAGGGQTLPAGRLADALAQTRPSRTHPAPDKGFHRRFFRHLADGGRGPHHQHRRGGGVPAAGHRGIAAAGYHRHGAGTEGPFHDIEVRTSNTIARTFTASTASSRWACGGATIWTTRKTRFIMSTANIHSDSFGNISSRSGSPDPEAVTGRVKTRIASTLCISPAPPAAVTR